MKPTEMTIYSKRQKNVIYALVLIPIIFFLIITVYQTDTELESYLNVDFLFIQYFTYLYLLIPSTLMRLLNKRPFSIATTMRIAILHVVMLILWLVLGKIALLGMNTTDWLPGLLFIGPFFAASIAYYFILTLPISDHQRPITPSYSRMIRKSRDPF